MRTVQLQGHLDIHHATRVRDRLLAEIRHGEDVVVDLAAVERIDSAGLASLVQAMSAARARRRRFQLRHVNGRVGRMLALARLDRVLPVQPTPPA